MLRRTFLMTALSASRVLGANERVRVGLIGCGGRCLHDAKHMRNSGGVDFPAVCDVYDKQLARGKEFAGPDCETYSDFRRLLERKDLDAVLIATPDHWHAIPTVMACDAGKHVYVEKPIAHNIREGRAMVEAAKRTGQIVHAGTQQRSAWHFAECADIVQGGHIGEVRFVRVWNFTNIFPKGIGHVADSAVPPGVDWDMYLGPAPQRPFNRLRFVRTYRLFWDYAGGYVTDFGTHRFDTVHQIMGMDKPLSVNATGGKYSVDDDSETPNAIQVSVQYPEFVLSYEGFMLNSFGIGPRTPDTKYYRARGADDRPNGMAFYGTKGTLVADRYAYDIYPERGSEVKRKSVQSYDATDKHTENFANVIRGKLKPMAPIEDGHLATNIAHLANISYRTGNKIQWDAEQEICKGDPEANRLLGRKARAPWDLLTCGTCS